MAIDDRYLDPLLPAPGTRRLEGQVVLLVGAGQTPGHAVGNGRASALVYSREGATVICVDRELAAAEETVALIEDEGNAAFALAADVTSEAAVEAMVAASLERAGRIDVLHNNVGAGLALGDAPVTEISVEAFDKVMALNLRSFILTSKHALPSMRERERGVIVNIGSFAAYANYPYIAYKTSKAGVVALTQNLAITNAPYGIRANVVVPGQINTPMAVNARVGVIGSSRDEVIAKRDAQVPLHHKMGTAWDVAHAALFLCSEEARFISGISLVVDGAQSLLVG
jgi:NAD(P)-dependent dehydrogenase (short-subunit alcohol dehydrogenase family)